MARTVADIVGHCDDEAVRTFGAAVGAARAAGIVRCRTADHARQVAAMFDQVLDEVAAHLVHRDDDPLGSVPPVIE